MMALARGFSTAPLILALTLTLVAPASGAWPWSSNDGPAKIAYPEITVEREWLKGRLGRRGVSVVDARSAAAYEAGHIRGALSLPAESLVETRSIELPRVLGEAGLDAEDSIVVCGDGTLSPASSLLLWLLELAGAERVAVLEGGFPAWASDGLDVETAATVLPPAAWTAMPVMERLATVEYVRDIYGADGVEIIDARGRDAWAGGPGAVADPASRTGHIPHALPYDFGHFVSPDGDLEEPEVTRKTFAMLGPRPSSPIDLSDEFIVYGLDALDGAVGYFLLRRAGVADVRLFPGGWTEWVSHASLPIVRIIGAEELRDRLDSDRSWFRSDDPPKSFILFDVRHPATHARGHVPGSVAVSSGDFGDSLDVYVERYWPGLDRSRAHLVSYCYGPNCIRSRLTSTIAARAGFLNVERFFGGMEEWREIGGRVARAGQ